MKLVDRPRVRALVSLLIRGKRAQLRGRGLQEKRYLNCGCGPNLHPNFINLDHYWSPGIQLCWDVTKRLPLGDASMSGIFSEHMLEHIPYDKVDSALKEFKRILEKNGKLRLVVPDAELYLDRYQSAKESKPGTFPYEEVNRHRFFTPMMHVNGLFRECGHQYAYDYETLRVLLGKAGFSRVTKEAFGHGSEVNLLIDSEERKIESLYVEAT